MKSTYWSIAGLVTLTLFTACNNDTDNNTIQTSTKTDTASATGTPNNMTQPTSQTNDELPFTREDSTFVMTAALGSMKEVEAGKIAQQNGQHPRVKSFGTMMERDHSGSNNELMALASGRGITLPSSLPPDLQKHVTEMGKLKGKAFDSHYMGMMVSDHQKTIAEFEKQANGGGDPQLKAWAAKTLPVLKMHHDSATAIHQAIK